MDETQPGNASPRAMWMVTFVELVALLVAFFVMLFAMSTIRYDLWDIMVHSLSQRLNPSLGGESVSSLADRNVTTELAATAADLDYLLVLLNEKASDRPLLAGATVKRLDDRLVIVLPAEAMFAPGSAVVDAEAREFVAVLADALTNVENRIDVIGHTDPEPIQSEAFPSNWELSIARAVAVAEEMRRAGVTREIRTLGFTDSRFSELAPGLAPDERRAAARRVEVVIRETFADG